MFLRGVSRSDAAASKQPEQHTPIFFNFFIINKKIIDNIATDASQAALSTPGTF